MCQKYFWSDQEKINRLLPRGKHCFTMSHNQLSITKHAPDNGLLGRYTNVSRESLGPLKYGDDSPKVLAAPKGNLIQLESKLYRARCLQKPHCNERSIYI